MSEATQVLRRKRSELETALAEVQREMSRADAAHRGPAHERLAGTMREARQWLEARRAGAEPEGEDASAEAARAEQLLHALRMGRGAL